MLPHESGFAGLRLYDWRREGQVQEIAAVILIRKLETYNDANNICNVFGLFKLFPKLHLNYA